MESFAIELRQYEGVNIVARPFGIADLRSRRALGRNERPEQLPLGPLLDPTPESRDFGVGQFVAAGGRRRHSDGFVVGTDAAKELTLLGVPGDQHFAATRE